MLGSKLYHVSKGSTGVNAIMIVSSCCRSATWRIITGVVPSSRHFLLPHRHPLLSGDEPETVHSLWSHVLAIAARGTFDASTLDSLWATHQIATAAGCSRTLRRWCFQGISGVLCKEQVSRAGISNYIQYCLWDVITCPRHCHLLLAQHPCRCTVWNDLYYSNWDCCVRFNTEISIQRFTVSHSN